MRILHVVSLFYIYIILLSSKKYIYDILVLNFYFKLYYDYALCYKKRKWRK